MKWRLLVALTLLTVSSLVLIWIAQSVFLSKIYINIKRNELCEVAETLTSCPESELGEKMTEAGKEHNLCIAAYRIYNDGKTPELIDNYDAKPSCGCLLHTLYRRVGPGFSLIAADVLTDLTKTAEEAKDVVFIDYEESGAVRNAPLQVRAGDAEGGTEEPPQSEKQAARVQRGSAPDPDNMSAVRVMDAGSYKILVLLNSSVIPMDSTVKTINTMMIYLSVFVILCAVIFALIIALWITKPIEDINASAKRLAECDYSVTFSGKGYKEVEELSDTLNYAAGELSKVDNLQKELIANISHDLRTPLTLIAGYAEIMRDLPDEKTEENLQIIIDESNRMKQLVNDVLDISKIGSGTESLTFEVLPLTNSIESELTRYNKLRDHDGYIIEFNYDEQVTVRGDYTRLMQVVYNLVNNAVNYAGPDKKVIVTQTVKNGRVRISVTDHGEGIEEEELPKIWDRYYKVDKTHKRATVGSGLGLSIVKGVVTAHGGSYGVTSVKGEGSTFWFELDALSSVPIKEE